MQAYYPARFDREVGCTEVEWLMWLPAALGTVPWQRHGPRIVAQLEPGTLSLTWQVLIERQIALIRLPRMAVCFEFSEVSDERRFVFMKRFDLYMQRGGG